MIVLVIDPANTAKVVSEVNVTVKKQNGKIVSKQVDGKLVSMDDYAVDKDFMGMKPPNTGSHDAVVDRFCQPAHHTGNPV
jgi:2',3'-cyclic-nucleotide 2'-phosphodiesterase/3'-nucleotidase